jgi:hypothetical protein
MGVPIVWVQDKSGGLPALEFVLVKRCDDRAPTAAEPDGEGVALIANWRVLRHLRVKLDRL